QSSRGVNPAYDIFFFSSRRRHTRSKRDWSSDVCSSDLERTRIHTYETIGTIEENMFWKLEELPENAIKYKGLCNGSVVDCYYIHTENGSKIYKPNPNAKEVYKPLQFDEHMEFIKNCG